MAAKDDSEKKTPSRDKIANDLREKIKTGSLAPGTKLPSEAEIKDQYEVSQTTARAALTVLRGEGLIEVKQGKGSFVRSFKPILRDATTRLSAQQWGREHAIWSADLGLRPMSVDELDVRVEDAPAEIAQMLGVTRVVVRDRVYAVEGRRVAIAVSYLPAEIAEGTPIQRPDTGLGGTYARLRDLGFEPAKFTELVDVRMPRPAERARLRLDVGEPVAAVRRFAKTAEDRLVEVNDQVLVGSAYRFQWSFTS